MTDDTEDRIWKVIERGTSFERADMSDSDDLRLDLAMDSLDFAEMEVSASERLGVVVGQDDFVGVKTVGQLRSKLKEMVDNAVGSSHPGN